MNGLVRLITPSRNANYHVDLTRNQGKEDQCQEEECFDFQIKTKHLYSHAANAEITHFFTQSQHQKLARVIRLYFHLLWQKNKSFDQTYTDGKTGKLIQESFSRRCCRLLQQVPKLEQPSWVANRIKAYIFGTSINPNLLWLHTKSLVLERVHQMDGSGCTLKVYFQKGCTIWVDNSIIMQSMHSSKSQDSVIEQQLIDQPKQAINILMKQIPFLYLCSSTFSFN